MIKAILFDLDGTLLPMKQDEFIERYFSLLCKRLVSCGYQADKLTKAIWGGTKAMMLNSGDKTNSEAFWQYFSGVFGDKVFEDEKIFEDFYKTDFQKVKDICTPTPLAQKAVSLAKEKGYRVILATNPLFPKIATQSRILWAGLNPDDFEFYSTYEDFYHSKPNPLYFEDIIKKAGLNPQECLMVGNDAAEDTSAQKVGIDVYLITDFLENKENRDISSYKHGSFEDFIKYLENL